MISEIHRTLRTTDTWHERTISGETNQLLIQKKKDANAPFQREIPHQLPTPHIALVSYQSRGHIVAEAVSWINLFKLYVGFYREFR